MSSVFPRSNLPPDAIPWGRAIQDLSIDNENKIAGLEASLLGENRSIAGQMGAIGRNILSIQGQQTEIQAQINELSSRSSGVVAGASVSVTSSSSTTWASATRTVTVPGEPDGTRTSIISFSAVCTQSGTGSGPTFIKIESGSLLLFTDSVYLDSSMPPGWDSMLQSTFVAPVASGGAPFVITMQAINLVAGTRTTTLSQIQMAYSRVDRV